jgi:hypothetical protein
MPDPNFSQILDCAGSPSVVVYGQFTTAGTGAVTGVSCRGISNLQVSRTGVGLFSIVLPTGWKNFQPVGLECGGAAAALTAYPRLRSATQSTKTVVIATVTPAAADADTTAVTVYFTFLLEKKGT